MNNKKCFLCGDTELIDYAIHVNNKTEPTCNKCTNAFLKGAYCGEGDGLNKAKRVLKSLGISEDIIKQIPN